MGSKQSSQLCNEITSYDDPQFYASPACYNKDSINNNLSCVESERVTYSEHLMENALEQNEEMWYDKYKEMEKAFNEQNDINIETFNRLHESVSNYVERSHSLKYRESLKDEVLDCYNNSGGESLKCSPEVIKYSDWLNQTRKSMTLSKDHNVKLSEINKL